MAMMLKSMGIDAEEITKSVKGLFDLASSIDTRLSAIENRLTAIEEATGTRPMLTITPTETREHA